jgi:hypothetical protein
MVKRRFAGMSIVIRGLSGLPLAAALGHNEWKKWTQKSQIL